MPDKMKNKSVKEMSSQKQNKKYRRFNKKGLVIFMIFAMLALLLLEDGTGKNFFQRMFSVSNITAAQSESVNGKKVIIDAGHGGFDDGGSSEFIDEVEQDLNLEMAYLLKDELESMDIEVELTRSDENALGENKDEDMAARQDMIYNSDADIMISIHCNSNEDSSVNGPINYFMPGSTQGEILAKNIQEQMNEDLDPEDPKEAQSTNFFVLRSGNMPSVLVETGFLSNEEEAEKLSDESYQEDIVKAISFGVVEYFNMESV